MSVNDGIKTGLGEVVQVADRRRWQSAMTKNSTKGGVVEVKKYTGGVSDA